MKLEDEDKVIILLPLLPPFFEYFIDTLQHGRQSITMVDVKDSFSFKKITKKAETKDKKGLIVKGRHEKRDNNKARQGKNLSQRIRA